MTYADITVRDRNPVKRWLHRRRFSDALSILGNVRHGGRLRVLDFGAGDGELVRQMVNIIPVEASVYEPTPALMVEAKENLAGLDSVEITDSLDSFEADSFDYVFCLEVFEHLPARESADATAAIHRLLKPDGIAVIGVPHELYLPALLKGLFRMCRRYGEFDATASNIAAAVLGQPPSRRPITEISPGLPFHVHHLGFDYRVLEQLLQQHLRLGRKWFSPFPILGAFLNSEVYFLLKKVEFVHVADAPKAMHLYERGTQCGQPDG